MGPISFLFGMLPLPFGHTFAAVAEGGAHRDNARCVLEVLRRPAAAAFLTLGDPLTYSTVTYLLSAVRDRAPRVPVRVVPGVTSFAAAATTVFSARCSQPEQVRLRGVGEVRRAAKSYLSLFPVRGRPAREAPR